MNNYRFNGKLINLISPILNHLKDQGITSSFLEEITRNPNTKYYLARNRYKNNPEMYLQLPIYKEVSQASGIHIVKSLIEVDPIKYVFPLKNKYIVITKPDPKNYPYYFDFVPNIPNESNK
jgi:hypothetical protein